MRDSAFQAQLTQVRYQVRIRIFQERRRPIVDRRGSRQYAIVCDVCKQSGPDAMHECLVTRGDATGNPELLMQIFHPINCVMVHNTVCHREAESKEGQKKLLELQVRRYGADAVLSWVRGLPFKQAPAGLVQALTEMKARQDAITQV